MSGGIIFCLFVAALYSFMAYDGIRILCSDASKSAKQDGVLFLTVAGAVLVMCVAIFFPR